MRVSGHASSPQAASTKRTFHVLIQPDISCANDTSQVRGCLGAVHRLSCSIIVNTLLRVRTGMRQWCGCSVFGFAVQLFRKIDSRALLVLAALIAGPSAAYAQTDEIQVYDAAIAEKGKFNLML